MRFTSLKMRIASLYTILFGATLTLIVVVAVQGLDRYGRAAASREMQADARVFQEILDRKTNAMAELAHVLSRDFGFREAVATEDTPTIASALVSVSERAGASFAFVIGPDGELVATNRTSNLPLPRMFHLDHNDGDAHGAMLVGDMLVLSVAVPIKAPHTIGQLIIGSALDEKEMARLARLSPNPIEAHAMTSASLPGSIRKLPLDQVIFQLEPAGEQLLWVTPLPELDPGLAPVLVLKHDLNMVLGQYTFLKRILMLIAALGMGLSVWLSARLANQITHPLQRLEEAVRQFSAGEFNQVPVESGDEVGRLAQTFNFMAEAIEERERRITAALHDPLTQLPSRRLFLEKLDEALHRVDPQQSVALMLLDLDDFKTVNDTLGHPAGDQLLREISARLVRTLPAGIVSRLGGDEFAVFIPDFYDPSALAEVAKGLLSCLKEEVQLEGQVVIPAGSLGIAIGPRDGDNSVTLMKHTDLALYAAKGEGKDCFRFFDHALGETATRHQMLERDLRRGIRDREFNLAFQPIFDMQDRRLSGFEALLRWPQPDGTVAGPLEFVPVAEKTGLINGLGDWVIDEACRQAVDWPNELTVSINISPKQLLNPHLIDSISNALVRYGLSPRRLEIEITENIFIQNHALMLSALRKLKTLGLRMALDDFGTGYSSLNLLRTFPFDRVKIDSSFVTDLSSDRNAGEVIRAIIALADALHIGTVAEGVETERQAEILVSEGCREIQGYIISKPMHGDQISGFIANVPDMARQMSGMASISHIETKYGKSIKS